MLIQKISVTTAGQDDADKADPAFQQDIKFKNSREQGNSNGAIQNTNTQTAPQAAGSTNATKQMPTSTSSSANSNSKSGNTFLLI